MSSFPGYSTDAVAVGVFRSLLRDFRALHGQNFACFAEHALNNSIQEFRSYQWPLIGFVDASRFKAWHQLRTIFKKYRFTQDAYTDKELEQLTMTSFFDAQVSFAVSKRLKLRTFAVLQEARRIAKEILGECDLDAVSAYVKVGRRATLGGPLEEAFLDRKVGDPKCFTCPTAVRKWFYTYLESDPQLGAEVRKVFKSTSTHRPDLAADSLTLVNVPKSWKTFRTITPLSLIGLFLSYGIGGLVTERLCKNAKLDIRKLQATHKRLACKYSRSRTHVTADLKRASDSIMSEHLNMVLPRQWYNLVKKTFVRTVVYNGKQSYSCSVLPMGNGATFPIETLFFYCLIRAVGNLLDVEGTYSVYGDDLIYPRRIHRFVAGIFADLGIVVNDDKTFVNSFFRESCGGDYYRGIDVRPAMFPQAESSHLKGRRYAGFLYKVANALRARWSDLEIPATLSWLRRELAWTQRVIYKVPWHYPADSGWKTNDPLGIEPWYEPWAQPKITFKSGRQQIHFRYLGRTTPKPRLVESEGMYYWESLRSISLRPPLNWRWRFWDSWLDDLPKSEQRTGCFPTFPYRIALSVDAAGKKKSYVLTCEPSKDEGYQHVVDESMSFDFWTQETS